MADVTVNYATLEYSGWAPELTHAQTESLRALEKAQAAEVTREANTVIRATPHPGDPHRARTNRPVSAAGKSRSTRRPRT
ncbi:MAG: hypothetical protein JO115_24990 [Pseudonocardiales bacterium]|nr:hypothetical protein [Pseudonocardiales bacterium]